MPRGCHAKVADVLHDIVDLILGHFAFGQAHFISRIARLAGPPQVQDHLQQVIKAIRPVQGRGDIRRQYANQSIDIIGDMQRHFSLRPSWLGVETVVNLCWLAVATGAPQSAPSRPA